MKLILQSVKQLCIFMLNSHLLSFTKCITCRFQLIGKKCKVKGNTNISKSVKKSPFLCLFSYHLQEDTTCKVIPAALYTESNSISGSISTTVSQVQFYYKLIENTYQVLTDLQSYKGFLKQLKLPKSFLNIRRLPVKADSQEWDWFWIV